MELRQTVLVRVHEVESMMMSLLKSEAERVAKEAIAGARAPSRVGQENVITTNN